MAEGVDVLGEELLQVRLDAVLDEAGVDAELVGRVVEHLVDVDGQAVLALGVLDAPDGDDALGGLALVGLGLGHRAGRRHPVERLVGAAVAVDEHRAVGLDDEQPGREREVGGEPPVVVDAAPGYDETHRSTLEEVAWGASRPGRVWAAHTLCETFAHGS